MKIIIWGQIDPIKANCPNCLGLPGGLHNRQAISPLPRIKCLCVTHSKSKCGISPWPYSCSPFAPVGPKHIFETIFHVVSRNEEKNTLNLLSTLIATMCSILQI